MRRTEALDALEVQVEIRHSPADAAQLAAWRWLWGRLLTSSGEDGTKNSKASKAPPSLALRGTTKNDAYKCTIRQ